MTTAAVVRQAILGRTAISILTTVLAADVRMVGHVLTLLATSPVSAQKIMRYVTEFHHSIEVMAETIVTPYTCRSFACCSVTCECISITTFI